MPELPEVEVTRRGIDAPLRGARVLDARLGKPLRWPLGVPVESFIGARIQDVSRRGKYLWLAFEPLATAPVPPGLPDHASGRFEAAPAERSGGLLIHLGMSGALRLGADWSDPGPHDHFDLLTSAGCLRLTDPRRFGAVVWAPALDEGAAAKLLSTLGAEPFDPDLDEARFHAALKARRAPIKAVLLAGDVVVGAGNIYACEALHRAGIDPRLPACRLSRPRAARLLAEVRQVLREALSLGGSTLRDFRDAHGMDGAFQASARVYGREGQPCLTCGAPVRRIVQAQRSTYLCRHCQKR